MSPWEILGIEPTDCLKTVKKAYRQQLKVYHPEDDPAGFMRLREAYEQVCDSINRGESSAVFGFHVEYSQESEWNNETPDNTSFDDTESQRQSPYSYDFSMPPEEKPVFAENSSYGDKTSEDMEQRSAEEIARELVALVLEPIKNRTISQANKNVVEVLSRLDEEAIDVKIIFEELILKGMIELGVYQDLALHKLSTFFEWKEGGLNYRRNKELQFLIDEMFRQYRQFCQAREKANREASRRRHANQNTHSDRNTVFEPKPYDASKNKTSYGVGGWIAGLAFFGLMFFVFYIFHSAHQPNEKQQHVKVTRLNGQSVPSGSYFPSSDKSRINYWPMETRSMSYGENSFGQGTYPSEMKSQRYVTEKNVDRLLSEWDENQRRIKAQSRARNCHRDPQNPEKHICEYKTPRKIDSSSEPEASSLYAKSKCRGDSGDYTKRYCEGEANPRTTWSRYKYHTDCYPDPANPGKQKCHQSLVANFSDSSASDRTSTTVKQQNCYRDPARPGEKICDTVESERGNSLYPKTSSLLYTSSKKSGSTDSSSGYSNSYVRKPTQKQEGPECYKDPLKPSKMICHSAGYHDRYRQRHTVNEHNNRENSSHDQQASASSAEGCFRDPMNPSRKICGAGTISSDESKPADQSNRNCYEDPFNPGEMVCD